jgi:DNA-binding NtrC family response regulator
VTSGSHRPIEGRAVRVLVVDDDVHVRRFTSLILGLEGFEVVEADGVREAIRLFEAGPVDVVVTDLNMPDENGAVLVGKLRRRDPALPIIILTGVGGADAALTSAVREFGALTTIHKPFSSVALVAAIRQALEAGRADTPT